MNGHGFLALSLSCYLSVFVLAQDRAALDALYMQATQSETNDPAAANRLYRQADSQRKAREAEPIDDVIEWLKSQDFSCLGSRRVFWNADGTEGTASDRVDVRERYVIECDGDCSGLRYLPHLQATMFHFAATQPVPVMEFKAIWFGGSNFQWKFSRPAGSKPPEVYIHRWSAAKMLSGQSCRAPKTDNRQ